MSEEINLKNLIEKKFRNLKLELKIIAYSLKKDYNTIYLFDKDALTLEPLKNIYDIIKKEKYEIPKDLLKQSIKKEISEDELEIHKTYLNKTYEADISGVTKKNIEKLVSKLNELSKSRRLMNEISNIVSNVQQFDLDSTEFKLKNIILNTNIKTRNSIDYVKDYEKRREHIKKVAKDPKRFSGIPTGIKEFDELSGGLMRGETGIIAMPTGQGKSVTLGNFATTAYYKGYNVAVCTLEMTNRNYAYRIDSRTARILYSKFRKAELDIFDYEKWEKKINRFKERKKNFMRIFELRRGATVTDIEAEIYRIQEEEEKLIDLLIVDYINLLSLEDYRGSNKDWKYQTDVAWYLKELSQEFNDKLGLPIWTASQVTDEGYTAKMLNPTHLKYARGISEVVQVVAWITQNKEDELDNVMKMFVIKCREFEKNKKPILLYPNFSYMLIDDDLKRQEHINRGSDDEE